MKFLTLGNSGPYVLNLCLLKSARGHNFCGKIGALQRQSSYYSKVIKKKNSYCVLYSQSHQYICPSPTRQILPVCKRPIVIYCDCTYGGKLLCAKPNVKN